jgi:excisionase family DNA binding protein
MVSTADRLLKITEVCERLSVSRQTLYKWINKGRFPAGQQLGGNVVRWRQSTLDTFIENLSKSE